MCGKLILATAKENWILSPFFGSYRLDRLEFSTNLTDEIGCLQFADLQLPDLGFVRELK